MKRLALEYLLNWKTKKDKMPLIVVGQKQAGKTYLILELFIKENYQKYVYIDFSKDTIAKELFKSTIKPKQLIQQLENLYDIRIDSDTILFFDEIQASGNAITSLKYFYQDTPHIPIICAGNLLGASIGKNHSLFPVGKVDFLDLYPLNFEEFLMNSNDILLSSIKEAYETMTPLPDQIHQLALDYLFNYLAIGGLPKVVDTYLQTNSFLESRNIVESVYIEYISSTTQFTINSQRELIKKSFDSVYYQLSKGNKNFKYSVIEKGKFKDEFMYPLEWLSQSYLINRSRCVSNKETSLTFDNDSTFRIYHSDMGMFTYSSGVQLNNLVMKSKRDSLKGIFFENYVSSELARYNIKQYYWKGKRKAELGFLIREGNGIVIPIDVKDNRGNLYSISEFMNVNETDYAVKISQSNLGFSKRIKTVPLYMTFMFLKEFNKNKY